MRRDQRRDDEGKASGGELNKLTKAVSPTMKVEQGLHRGSVVPTVMYGSETGRGTVIRDHN